MKTQKKNAYPEDRLLLARLAKSEKEKKSKKHKISSMGHMYFSIRGLFWGR